MVIRFGSVVVDKGLGDVWRINKRTEGKNGTTGG